MGGEKYDEIFTSVENYFVHAAPPRTLGFVVQKTEWGAKQCGSRNRRCKWNREEGQFLFQREVLYMFYGICVAENERHSSMRAKYV